MFHQKKNEIRSLESFNQFIHLIRITIKIDLGISFPIYEVIVILDSNCIK
jgi:hypothetical protein